MIHYFKIDAIEIFVDMSLSYFNKAHTPSKIWQCLEAFDVTVTSMVTTYANSVYAIAYTQNHCIFVFCFDDRISRIHFIIYCIGDEKITCWKYF